MSTMVITNIWQFESLTVIILIWKEVLNLLMRSRPWLSTVPMSDFLIRQEVHEGISYIRWERGNFYYRPWKAKRKTTLKNFWTNSSIPSKQYALVFLWREEFQPGLDVELTEQLLACSVPTKCNNIYKKQSPSPHHGVWGGHKQ